MDRALGGLCSEFAVFEDTLAEANAECFYVFWVAYFFREKANRNPRMLATDFAGQFNSELRPFKNFAAQNYTRTTPAMQQVTQQEKNFLRKHLGSADEKLRLRAELIARHAQQKAEAVARMKSRSSSENSI